MSEQVPQGWKYVTLGSLCSSIRGVSYKPEDLREQKSTQTVTLLRSNNIQEGGVDLNDVQNVDIAKVKQNQIMSEGDIAVCMSNGSRRLVGKSATLKAIANNENFTVGAFCSIIKVNEKNSRQFVRQLLKSDEYTKQVEFSLAGSAINNLKDSDVENYVFTVPPSSEREKIASILTSVDEVIENTQKQIDKLQDLKKATMNELLTKGIGHTEFKDSELGRIPKSWEVVELGNSVKKPICYGIVQVGDFDSNGVKVIAIKYLGKINASHLHRSKKTIEEKYKRSRVTSGDLLISIKGTIGRIDIVPDDFVGNISRDIARISLSSDHIPDVIQAYLESSVGKTNIAQTTVGTTRAELSIGRLVELKIPKIPLNEQVIIKQIYDSFNIEIATKFKKLSQTQSLKKSLMQDLLTGKVRVQVN